MTADKTPTPQEVEEALACSDTGPCAGPGMCAPILAQAYRQARAQLAEAKKEVTEARRGVGAPKDCGVSGCGHNAYWIGQYGTCMACRAEQAGSALAESQRETRAMSANYVAEMGRREKAEAERDALRKELAGTAHQLEAHQAVVQNQARLLGEAREALSRSATNLRWHLKNSSGPDGSARDTKSVLESVTHALSRLPPPESGVRQSIIKAGLDPKNHEPPDAQKRIDILTGKRTAPESGGEERR